MGIYTKKGAAILSHNLSGKRGRFENLLGRIILVAITLVLILMLPGRVMAQSTDASLSNLTISPGSLQPGFDPNPNTSYTASVSNSTTTVSVTPTSTDPTATITVNGATVISTNASSPISLLVGPNTIT